MKRFILAFVLSLVWSMRAFSAGVEIYTTDFSGDKLIRFDSITGAFNTLVDGGMGNPQGIAIGSDRNIYISQRYGTYNVVRYSSDGTPLGSFTPSLQNSLGLGQIAFSESGNLIVAGNINTTLTETRPGSVFVHSPINGSILSTYNMAGVNNIVGLHVDGNVVYTADIFDGDIVRYDLSLGNAAGELVVDNSITFGRYKTTALTIGHNGNLFVASRDWDFEGLIYEYDPSSGQLVGTFTSGISTGITDLIYDAQNQQYWYSRGDVLGLIDISGDVISEYVNPDGGNFSALTIAPSAVPIPAAFWLFGSALGLLGWMRRNR